MKLIGFEDILKMNISPLLCHTWVVQMLQNKKNAILPPKAHMAMEGNVFCNVMPSIIQVGEHAVGGVKIVTRYPERQPALDSLIMLYDAETGDFLALLDGDWITAMRTGAVAAHSISLLAVKDFCELGIIGLGNTARSSLLVLLSLYPDREFHIRLLRYKNQAELFMERFAGYDNIRFDVMNDVKDLVKGSHVVLSCATYFENDICPDECFDEGVLVVPVHTRGFTNCDLFFDKVYADDTGHVNHFKNFSKFRYFAEVSDVLCGAMAGRENDRERIMAYNIGVSIHDVYFAYKIYKMIEGNKEAFNCLKDLNLEKPEEKFWV